MRLLSVLDSRDYNQGWPLVERTAVRAIIPKEDMVAVLFGDRYQDYKLPGGGVKKREPYFSALEREVREETGLLVVDTSIREFGEVMELRKGRFGNERYQHRSLIYICDVKEERVVPNPEQYEVDFGYHLVFAKIDEIIRVNEELKEPLSWTKRDTMILELYQKETQNGK